MCAAQRFQSDQMQQQSVQNHYRIDQNLSACRNQVVHISKQSDAAAKHDNHSRMETMHDNHSGRPLVAATCVAAIGGPPLSSSVDQARPPHANAGQILCCNHTLEAHARGRMLCHGLRNSKSKVTAKRRWCSYAEAMVNEQHRRCKAELACLGRGSGQEGTSPIYCKARQALSDMSPLCTQPALDSACKVSCRSASPHRKCGRAGRACERCCGCVKNCTRPAGRPPHPAVGTANFRTCKVPCRSTYRSVRHG